jgi:uncharacterized RDD family membrane protein YckC
MAIKSIEFESVQHVPIEFELASSGQRAIAMLIDFIVFITLIILLSAGLGFETIMNNASSVGLIFRLPFILYFPICESLFNGQSIGKYTIGIRVVTTNGKSPGIKEIMTRWLFRGDYLWLTLNYYTFLWFGFGLTGYFISLTSNYSQRLGDSFAGTLVIRNKSSSRFRIKDLHNIKNKEEHTPEYTNLHRFTDEDMMLIKNALERLNRYPNKEIEGFVCKLAEETARLIELPEQNKPPKEFLQTVFRDYIIVTR